MSPRLPRPFIVIGFITIIVIAIFVVPRGLSLYYQIKGGQHIEYVLRFEEGIQELDCEPPQPTNEEARKEVENGIDDLTRAIRLNKNNVQAYYYLGNAHCFLGEPEEAKKNYLQYTELRPKNPLGYIGLGFAYEKLDDSFSSKSAWKSAGLTPFEFNSAGDEEFKAERFENALGWYQRSILIDPKSAESLLKIGNVYDQLKDNESALEVYRQAWDSDPELSTSALIDAYKRVGDINAVENVLQEMLQNQPNSSDRLLWLQELGSSYLSHGDYDQAVELYSHAINEFPDQPELHISLGWALYERGDGVEAARNEFIRAIDLNGESGTGYYATGQLFYREEDYVAAENWLRQAVELEPGIKWYAIILGNTYRSSGNLDSAVEVYEQVIKKHPNYDRAHLELAQVFYMQGHNDEAKLSIEKAIQYAPSPPEWYFIRAGRIFEQAGEFETALKYYYQALGINPTNSTALQAVDLLED